MGLERDAPPSSISCLRATRRLRILQQTRPILFTSIAAVAAVTLCVLVALGLSIVIDSSHGKVPASNWNLLRGAVGLGNCIAIDESHFDEQYFDPDACISPQARTETLLDLVKTLTKLLDERDLDYWLDSGTLLGQFRAQTVIPWDNDADLGITMQGYTFLRDNRIKLATQYELQVYESEVNLSYDRDWSIPARFVDTKYGFYVDIFVFTESVANDVVLLGTSPSSSWNECVKCLQVSKYSKLLLIPRDYVYPLISCPFGGIEVLCPAKRTLYLEHLYGGDFRSEKASS